jgi:hypothetical protein
VEKMAVNPGVTLSRFSLAVLHRGKGPRRAADKQRGEPITGIQQFVRYRDATASFIWAGGKRGIAAGPGKQYQVSHLRGIGLAMKSPAGP